LPGITHRPIELLRTLQGGPGCGVVHFVIGKRAQLNSMFPLLLTIPQCVSQKRLGVRAKSLRFFHIEGGEPCSVALLLEEEHGVVQMTQR
jgi:hypothetical protein